MQPFSNFTARAQETVRRAHELAIERGQNQIDVQHLLAALVLQEDSMIVSILERLNVDIDFLTDSIVGSMAEVDHGSVATPSYQIYLAPNLAKVFEASHKVAQSLGDDFVSVEHIFIGILDVPSSARNMLTRFRISKEKVLSIVGDIRESSEPEAEDAKKFHLLSKYARNLTKLAAEDKLDPVVGRENEIKRIMQVLSRRTKNNPILIGEAGTGKTAIAEGLAERIAHGDVPEPLKEKELVSLDIGLLVAGTKYRGEFEERLKGLMKEIGRSDGKILLFIDEVHTIVGAGAAEGAIDASNMLKPALARGELRVIGATTLKEYQRHIEKDPALTRRFQPVYVDEPSLDDAMSILRGLRYKYELYHGIKITDDAIRSAVQLSARYLTDRFLPDKAIDLIDEASSSLRLQLDSKPEKLESVTREITHLEIERESLKKDGKNGKRAKEIDKEIANLKEQIRGLGSKWKNEKDTIETIHGIKKQIDDLRLKSDTAERAINFTRVAEIRYGEIPELEKKLHGEERKLKRLQSSRKILKEEITDEDVASVVSKWTGVPVVKMLQEESKKLLNMESVLKKKVIGQDEAIAKISNAVRRSRAGISDENRPIGSFMFLGQTGVGKTYLAKQLAEFMFNDEKALIRIDMSEYMEKHSISKMMGAPAGYIGYEEGGQLTEMVRHRPYSVILFDEIEKAHPEVFNLLLQVLDEGRMTDAKGRKVNFKNTVIILTSNVGSEHAREMNALGFTANAKGASNVLKGKIMESLEARFRPEFLNRLDEIITFNSLTHKDIERIVKVQVALTMKRLSERNINITFTAPAISELAKQGYSERYGVRPLQRLIKSKVLNPIAEKIIRGDIREGDKVTVGCRKGGFDVVVSSRRAKRSSKTRQDREKVLV